MTTHGPDVGLEVADDGSGTDGSEGAGLAGVRERIAALGGEVTVDGSPLKDAPVAKLVGAVHAGRRAIDPELATDAWSEPDPLTERERQVVRLAGEGLGNAEIADRLILSEGTVRNCLSEAMGRLGATNRVAAARIARDQGWL